jgi:hypothetical protein
MLVEDEFARCLARSVLRNLAPELLEYFEIVNAVSDSGVVKGLEGLPKLKDWFSLVGVFDGDQREAQKDKSYAWPHLFLPGPLRPEAVIQNVIKTQPHEVAESVGCNNEQLQVACDAAEGMELHEWVKVVRQTLSLEPQALVDGVVRVWLADEANRKACDELVSGLRERAYLVRKKEQIAGQKSVVAVDAAPQPK